MQRFILKSKSQSGYVALISTIIIGAVLLVMTIEAGQAGWYTRFIVLGAEAKMQSRTLARSCAEQALAKTMTDPTWIGGATTTSSTGSCYIFPLQKNHPTNEALTIRVQAVVRGSYTNMIFVYDMHDIHQSATPKELPLPVRVTEPNLIPELISITEVAVLP
jgi:hypothetical protein